MSAGTEPDGSGGAPGGAGSDPGAGAAQGLSASHPTRSAQPFLVAPTTANEFNTLSLDLIAVACVQVPDMLFEFDSSFPMPSVAPMLQQIPALRQKHRSAKGLAPPMSVFGHADPTGDDEYNKQLSGRRAIAIFAALTHDLALWNSLFDHAHGGDDWKGKDVTATMRTATGAPANQARDDLSLAYMALLSPTQHAKGDFLGKGADAKGKADFQGCSEFNPLVLLSTTENATLPKAKRNEENAINRRVIVFMFRPGTVINPGLWPCPTALAASAGCVKRFFGPPRTGNLRRAPGPQRREFAKTLDTFACRFYDRVARLSPCEVPIPPVILLVGPQIVFASAGTSKGVVVVKKPHTAPKRVPVRLRSDAGFDGSGEFTAAPADKIQFFRAATGGAAIAFDKVQNKFTGAELTAGLTLFAEGVKTSGADDDVTLTLRLSGGAKVLQNNPATAKMTAVELFLDIHKMRKSAGADPAALTEGEKIDPGRAIHVQNAAKQRRRAMLVLKKVKPSNFKGPLELTLSNAKLAVFEKESAPAAGAADPQKATPLEIDPTKLPIKLFVEGAAVSDKLKDSSVLLGIKGLEPDGDHVVVTVIEAKLDICQSRTKPDQPGAPMSDGDKLKIGRFVHVQDGGASPGKHRALMIVRQVKPAGFVGKLVLSAVESVAKPSGAAKLRVFATEAAGTGAALALPLVIDHPAAFPAAGEQRFVEGGTLSTALVDSGLRLGVQDVDDECDRFAATVFKVEKVELKLARTRCRGTAAGDMPPKVFLTDTTAFDAGTPTVVRQCGDLKLEATVKPANVPVVWDVQRATDDAAALTGLPTHAADGAAHKRKLTADATGSFHVFVFVDANSDGKHGDDEDGMAVNLNMVEVKVPAGAANNRVFQNPNYSNARSATVPGTLIVDSGTSQGTFTIAPGIGGAYGDAEFVKHLVGFKVTVNLIGGGADQRRGVTKLTLGYNQTTTSDSVVGTYADGRTERETLFVTPIPPANLGPGGQVISGPALPTLAFPVRDTRGASRAGAGIFIISSSDANPPDKINLPAGGEQRIVRMIDPPAIAIDLVHPVTGSALASIAGSNDFGVFLCAVSSDFDENFTAVASGAWRTTYGTFTAAGGWTNAGAALTASALTVHSPAKKGDDVAMERCPPNFVDSIPMDAR